MARQRDAIDWPAIRSEYLRDEDSLREIADRYSISEAAIRKRAKADGWPPRAKQVRKAANCEPPVRTTPAPRPATEEEAEKAADPAAIVAAGRGLVRRMLDELDSVTAHAGEVEDLILVETANDVNGKRRDGMLRAVSLGGRAATLKELATALKTLGEASAPAGKKASAQDKANAVASRFRAMGPPALKVVGP